MRKLLNAGAGPSQLPLFPDAASLTRIHPARNEWRFYRLEVWPDLFGRALLLRHWGRIGTEGRRRLDPHPDTGAAINALAHLAGRVVVATRIAGREPAADPESDRAPEARGSAGWHGAAHR